MPADSPVRVVCRFRPVNEREELEAKQQAISNPVCVTINEDVHAVMIPLASAPNPIEFYLDDVLGMSMGQDDTFYRVAEPTIKDVLRGYNGTIFAYGQTGSGKTHSMYGPEGKFNAAESGLVPRAVSMLFQSLEDKEDIKEYTMKVSFIEIYMEKMRDLLANAVGDGKSTKKRGNSNAADLDDLPEKAPSIKKNKSTGKNGNKGPKGKKGGNTRTSKKLKKDYKSLKVRTLPNGQSYIQNLYEEEVGDMMDVLGLIAQATKERTTSATQMNRTSSRSHLVMLVSLEQKMIDASIKISKLNFADLAGSEKVKKTQATGQRLEEAKMINKSLSQLGLVIRALSEKKSFISYRDSTLTHILKDSLGGNTKTTLLCCCSPHIFNRDETISTLRFATRAKLITNVVYKNTVLSPQQMANLIKSLRGEVDTLKSKLEDKVIKELKKDNTEDKSRGFASSKTSMAASRKRPSLIVSTETHRQLVQDLERYKMENAQLKEQVDNMTKKEEDLKRQIAELKSQLIDEKSRNEELLLKIEELTKELNNLKLENTQKDKTIEQLKNKITDLNAKLLEAAGAAKKDKMQLELLSVVYEGKLKALEARTKDISHQFELVKQRLDRNTEDKKDADFRYEKGDLSEIDYLRQTESLQYENKYLSEQETRLGKILGLFEKEKELLKKQKENTEASLQQEIETLKNYINLKDSQFEDMRKNLETFSEQMQNKDNKLVSVNDENRQLREKLELMEKENEQLQKRISAYFNFENVAPSSVGSDGARSAMPWDSLSGARSRGATISSTGAPKHVARRSSIDQAAVAADRLVDVENYFVEFAKMRKDREEREKEEREKKKKEEAEMERKRKSIEIKPSKVSKITHANTVSNLAQYASSNGLDMEPKQNGHIRDRTSSKDFGTINRYGKKKRRKSKTKFNRSKVAAMIAGFEQIEKKDQVFDSEEEEEDDMLLNMLPTAQTSSLNVDQWSVEDVCSWLKSIDLGMYVETIRENRIDGSILVHDIQTETDLMKIGVAELHAKKLLREIKLLKNEANIDYDFEDEKAALDNLDGVELVSIDPFEMIKALFKEMDPNEKGFISLDDFRNNLGVVDINLTEEQTIIVYNAFHFGGADGITEEEMLLTLGKVFTEHSCNNAKTAFRLACVYFLQAQGLMDNTYASHLEDLFENSEEVKKNLEVWKNNALDANATGIGIIKPFLEEKLMKLMMIAGRKVVIIDGKRIPTIEEFDDMQCARMAGDACHLSVLKIWWMQSIVHGMQSTYTSADGKHFTTIRHCTPMVSDDNEDLHETVITLKHDEFIKYCSVGATNFLHNITIVTTLGTRYSCGLNRSDKVIQFKPPSGCGILAFYGNLTGNGMSSLGCYTVRNEKSKLRSMTAAGVEQAHQRAKLRATLKNKIKKGVQLEEAIGYVMDNYNEIQVRELIEGNNKGLFKQVLNDIGGTLKPKPQQMRKVSFLGFIGK